VSGGGYLIEHGTSFRRSAHIDAALVEQASLLIESLNIVDSKIEAEWSIVTFGGAGK
jgi:hypothetical protein